MKPYTSIRRNSVRAWLLASRPKTLSGAAMPVLVTLALAFADSGMLRWIPAVLCLLFALTMQVLANFVNDYFDFLDGTDDAHRLGPRRACAQGWVSARAMRWAIAFVALLASAVGLPLIVYGGWSMLAVGAGCMALCFFYTLGGARHALGDVLVLLGFGIIPVCVSYLLQTNALPLHTLLFSIACGLVVDTLLVVNNYRDYPTDRRCGKRTLVVRIGLQWSERLYLTLPLLAWGCTAGHCISQQRWCTLTLPLLYLLMHIATYHRMKKIGSGKALNSILGENSRNMLVYGITIIAGLLID